MKQANPQKFPQSYSNFEAFYADYFLNFPSKKIALIVGYSEELTRDDGGDYWVFSPVLIRGAQNNDNYSIAFFSKLMLVQEIENVGSSILKITLKQFEDEWNQFSAYNYIDLLGRISCEDRWLNVYFREQELALLKDNLNEYENELTYCLRKYSILQNNEKIVTQLLSLIHILSKPEFSSHLEDLTIPISLNQTRKNSLEDVHSETKTVSKSNLDTDEENESNKSVIDEYSLESKDDQSENESIQNTILVTNSSCFVSIHNPSPEPRKIETKRPILNKEEIIIRFRSKIAASLFEDLYINSKAKVPIELCTLFYLIKSGQSSREDDLRKFEELAEDWAITKLFHHQSNCTSNEKENLQGVGYQKSGDTLIYENKERSGPRLNSETNLIGLLPLNDGDVIQQLIIRSR